MKNTVLFFSLFSLFSLFPEKVFSQAKQDTVPKTPAAGTVKDTAKTQKMVYHDYNFGFLTSPEYTQIAVTYKLDSVTQKFLPVQDSSRLNFQFIVTKDRDQITITSIDPAKPFSYNEKVRFVGITEDGYFSLVYRSLSKNQELIMINPLFGFAIISAKDCSKPQVIKGKNCDLKNHYFGACDTRLFR